MTYELFKKELLSKMKEDKAHSYQFISKSAGTSRKDFLICTDLLMEDGAPVLDVSGLYDFFEEEKDCSISDVAQMLRSQVLFCEVLKKPDKFDNYETVKEMLCCRLINPKHDASLLKYVAHMPYLNLEVVFYLDSGMSDSQHAVSCIVCNDLFQRWNITMEELFETAKRNLLRLNPPAILPVMEIASEMTNMLNKPDLIQMVKDTFQNKSCYLVTNQKNCFGASLLLFPELFEFIARKDNTDLFLMLISEHAIAVEPVSDELADIKTVMGILNNSKDNEAMSGEVYCYRQGSRRISICIPPTKY